MVCPPRSSYGVVFWSLSSSGRAFVYFSRRAGFFFFFFTRTAAAVRVDGRIYGVGGAGSDVLLVLDCCAPRPHVFRVEVMK